MQEITVKQLEEKSKECFEKREEYKKAKEETSKIFADFERAQGELVSMLEALEKEKYESKYGIISYKYQSSFKTPKTEEDKKKFFDYLKSRGVYESMVTVNSRTLNSWAKEEEENSEELDFKVPGLEKTAPVAKASMRKIRESGN